MKILIADDNELALEALDHALRAAGHQTLQARNGREALRVLRDDSCRLVISDWSMPEMDGLELCRQVRAQNFSHYIYFILLTSKDSQSELIQGLSAGADEFMLKPFDPAELAVRLRTADRILGLETRDITIFALAKLAESRDNDTGAHLERVRNYSCMLARRLYESGHYRDQLDSDFIRLIYLTSPLHDIGKVGIPDSVLLKPAPLTDKEYDLMKTHTLIGAETLDSALRQYPHARFLHMARDIALTHHEHYDGHGYPQGLCGHAIPLCGRIVALADVYDALTTERVYKPALPHDVAKQIIVDQSGKQFDPLVVEAFLGCEARFAQVMSGDYAGQNREAAGV